jgi:saccharopine dehydrogenase (NAD+, L-lysine forming)
MLQSKKTAFIRSFRMAKTLIIGAGGAGSVCIKKCVSLPDVFGHVHVASRTLSKCERIKADCNHAISISKLDADDSEAVYQLIKKLDAEIVINLALPYQDLSIMDACIRAQVNYVDTANYEPKDEAKFCYKWQWDYQERFKEANILALLGSGFDPGVTNVFTAYAQKHYFDEIHTIDIVDCNDGDHGHPFATNFNPEINIREVTQRGKYWENGQWIEVDPLSISKMIDFPEVGPRKGYLLYHEELESLVKNIPHLKSIKFWMTFSDSYITHLEVLQNVGMTRIDPISFNGQDIVPLQFLKALLPEPSSLSDNYTGKTSIGCIFEGIKDGQKKKMMIYNVCHHQECHEEVGAQAVSYTTGVPAMIGAKMILEKKWTGTGVFNIEEFNPDPFMADLNAHGLAWKTLSL